jgi:hypothetical protein
MARMLPSNIFEGCPSPGEREIFDLLKNSPETRDWVVLHSLDLANHVRQVSGEADFVVLIPEIGILCLEVKACLSIHRDDRGWYYGKEIAPNPKGPFRQASEAMHSIRNRVIRAKQGLAGTPFSSVVVLPYLQFNILSNEWHHWQVIDSNKIKSHGLVESLRHSMRMARLHMEEKGVFNNVSKRPTLSEAKDIANILRPSFEVFAQTRNLSEKLRTQLKAFTSEQYSALDAMESNPRVMFRGPAGTGKTVLAIEAARRAAASGKKVLLICFNRLLSSWISSELADLQTGVTVSTLHAFALSVAKVSRDEISQLSESEAFWSVDLPYRALSALLNDSDDSGKRFDMLIVDEAQDIATSEYLDMLDFSLVGGLQDGVWRIFADFENQAIYRAESGINALEMLTAHSGLFSVFSLRTNCRNPPRIACLAHLLGRLDPDYNRILRPDNGIEPDIFYYGDQTQQSELLAEQLEHICREGFEVSEIVILSPKGAQSCASQLAKRSEWRERIGPLDTRVTKRIAHTTIHAFKGLEAQVVVVTDLEVLGEKSAADLFYVAVTRPVERLVLLMNAAGKRSVINALQGKAFGE